MSKMIYNFLNQLVIDTIKKIVEFYTFLLFSNRLQQSEFRRNTYEPKKSMN